jgi:O-antigen/teichoic acid export membrane protein
MNRALSLRKNFAWTFAGSLIAGGAQWAMLMVLTKVLEPAEVGHYLLGLAITAPVVILTMLNLRAVQATDAQNLNKFEDFLAVRLITNLLAVLTVIVILLFLGSRYSFRVYLIILAIALNKVIEATSDIAYGLMQKNERLDKMAQSLILRNVGALVLLAVVSLLTKNLLFGVVSMSIWWLVILLSFDKCNVEKFEPFAPRFQPKPMLSIIILGLPLGISAGIMSFNSNMNRYFVEAYLGSENLAYFGAMAYIVIGASQVTMSLGQAASPRLAKYYFFNRKAFIVLLGKMLAVVLTLAVAAVLFGVFFGKPFLSMVYEPKYAERQDVFVWLLISAGVTMLASMLGFGMTATRRFKSQIPVFLAVCIISILACWLLIPRYGMKGAAWSMLVASITQCVSSLIVILIALKTAAAADTDNKNVNIENAG